LSPLFLPSHANSPDTTEEHTAIEESIAIEDSTATGGDHQLIQPSHINFIHETWAEIMRRAAALPPIWDHIAQGNVDEELGAWHFYNRSEDLRDYVQDQLNQRPPLSDD
jgi:hypothetical protein